MSPLPRRRRVSPLLAGLLVLLGFMPRGPLYLWHDHQDHAHVEFHLAAHGANATEHEHLEAHDERHVGHPSDHSDAHHSESPADSPTWADNSHHHHELTADDSLRAARHEASAASMPAVRVVDAASTSSPARYATDFRPRPPRDRPGPAPGLATIRLTVILV
jgi:hypothetical protein